MTSKNAVIEMIRKLPEDASLTDIMAELYVRLKVDKGIEQLDSGEGLSHEEVKKRLDRWLS